MLKGFVSGEEKDIVRIPMKGKNLFDKNSTTTNERGESRPGVELQAGTYSINNGSTRAVYYRVGYSGQAYQINPGMEVENIVASDTLYVWQVLKEDGVMVSEGGVALPYEPYGYQEGWEVRDNQDRLIWGREDELQTATGTLPFKGYALPVKVKSLLGNTVQNGTPTPDNPVMPEFVGVRTGNLFDKSAADTNNGYIVDGYLKSDGSKNANTEYRASEYILIKPNQAYMLFYGSNLNNPSVCFYDSAKNFISGVAYSGRWNVLFTTPQSAAFLRLSFRAVDKNAIMLNLGSTALPYEPYGYKIPLTNAGQTVPVYLGQTQTVRRVKKLVLTGEESVTAFATSGVYGISGQTQPIANYQYQICSHYIPKNSWADIQATNLSFGVASTNVLVIHDNAYNSAAAFKSYLASEYAAGHPVTVWYVLANEQTGIVNEPLCKIGDYADELTTIQAHGLSAPLYGIGDYKDTLNLSTGVVTRKVKKLVLTGEENITYNTVDRNRLMLQSVYTLPTIGTTTATNIICTHLETLGSGSATSTQQGIAMRYNGSDVLFGVTFNTIGATTEDGNNAINAKFKTFLAAQYQAGTPVTIWYVLNTPETETVTVPTGMTGEIEGYLTQVSTPSPTNRSVPKWNGVEESGGTYAVTVYTPPEIPTTTGQNTLTVETDLAPSKLEVSIHAKKIHYGFKIDKSNDDSESAVIYTHDAVTMTPAHMDFTNDRFDYGSWGNAFFVRDCHPVALNLDGTEAYRLDPDDYTKKMDGTSSDIFYELLATEPSDWSTQWKQYYTKDANDNYELNSQGSAPTFTTDTYYKLTYSSSFTGNFMMAFPKVWFYRHEDSQYNYIEISNHRLSNDWKCYAHINTNGQEVDFIYLPLFKGVIKDSKLRSLPGQIPQGNTTATTEVNAATALGSRWQIWDHSSVELINDLLTLMSKSIDSQGRFGQGRSSGYDSTDTVTYGKLQTGTLIKKGKFHGYSATTKEVKVFGIEGFWANRWDRLQGMLLVDNVWKIKMTPPYNFTGTDFVTLSNASVPTGNGYLSKVQTSEYGSIPASIEGGASSKFYKDYFYKTATSTRVAVRGGYCGSGAFCGFRYVHVNYPASSSGWSIGASPVYK